jgi:hypothetical protein
MGFFIALFVLVVVRRRLTLRVFGRRCRSPAERIRAPQ